MQILPKVNTLRKGSLLYRSIRYRKGFGVHSPFVFNLITKVIEEKCSYYSFYDIELLRKQLLFREGEITYPDRQNKGKRKTRSISEIVKRESIRPKHGALLFRLTNYFKSKNILQIGHQVKHLLVFLIFVARTPARHRRRCCRIGVCHYVCRLWKPCHTAGSGKPLSA